MSSLGLFACLTHSRKSINFRFLSCLLPSLATYSLCPILTHRATVHTRPRDWARWTLSPRKCRAKAVPRSSPRPGGGRGLFLILCHEKAPLWGLLGENMFILFPELCEPCIELPRLRGPCVAGEGSRPPPGWRGMKRPIQPGRLPTAAPGSSPVPGGSLVSLPVSLRSALRARCVDGVGSSHCRPST